MYGPHGFRECRGDYRDELDLEDVTKPMYRHQSALPHLPVPPLQETVTRYLETVAPLATAEELATTKALAATFMSSTGVGPTLQRRLEERATKTHGDTSYLAHWWNTLGYLQVRDPVVFNVSYFFHFADSVHRMERSQCGRAASLLRATMEFRNQVVDGSLAPELLGPAQNPTAICATAYKYMFNACRIPHRGQDTYRIYDPAIHQHAVVLRHGLFYKVDLVDTSGHRVLSAEELRIQLERVVARADQDAAASGTVALGVLSSGDRDTWADARDELVRSGNEAALRVIESAVVALTLDPQRPVTRTEMARALWHGDARNRFYDKSVQLSVFANGKAGLLGEHSMLDGMPMARYADYMVTRLHRQQIAMGTPPVSSSIVVDGLPSPTRVEWTVSSATRASVVAAGRVFDQLVDNHDVHVQSFYGYGKNAMKQFRCSPDAFVQLAIQLAHKKSCGRDVATYEATQTRTFLHGRTETTRSCTRASVAFTSAMVDADAGVDVEKKKALLLAAVAAHVGYMKQAARGHGVDRHLMALRLLVDADKDGPVPFLLEDPLMERSRYWRVSTSHLTNERFDGWGWGQVVPEGLGIAYSIKNDSVQFNIACLRQRHEPRAARMGHLLEESLVEMQQLFTAVVPAARAAKL